MANSDRRVLKNNVENSVSFPDNQDPFLRSSQCDDQWAGFSLSLGIVSTGTTHI